MRILFVTRHLNSSGFATLNRLIEEKFDICGVLLAKQSSTWTSRWLRLIALCLYRAECYFYRCRPLKVTTSERLLSRAAGLRVIEVDSIKSAETFNALSALAPDLIVIGGGWHELIPPAIFKIPRLGCINAHPSLLPDFRGTSITRWQVLGGVRKSGCTIHYVNEAFDSGAILAQESLAVPEGVTPQELFSSLSTLAAEMMVKVLRRFESEGALTGTDVADAAAKSRYYHRWKWNDSRLEIDWRRTFREIDCFVRANTQESYRYLGPWFESESGPFFLRQSVLRPATGRASAAWPEVVEFSDGIVWLEKLGDRESFGIVQVQPKGTCFRFCRARSASRKLIVKQPTSS
jgi:methionyl-tRNA formyltransferase